MEPLQNCEGSRAKPHGARYVQRGSQALPAQPANKVPGLRQLKEWAYHVEPYAAPVQLLYKLPLWSALHKVLCGWPLSLASFNGAITPFGRRITVFWGLYWGPPIEANYHLLLAVRHPFRGQMCWGMHHCGHTCQNTSWVQVLTTPSSAPVGNRAETTHMRPSDEKIMGDRQEDTEKRNKRGGRRSEGRGKNLQPRRQQHPSKREDVQNVALMILAGIRTSRQIQNHQTRPAEIQRAAGRE